MNERVGNDPLERLVAQFGDAEISGAPEFVVAQSGDPLERLGELIVAARDLSGAMDGVQAEGVLGELLGRIESARVIEAVGETGLRAADVNDPRATIAGWIEDERAELGGVPTIVRLRAVDARGVEKVATGHRGVSESGVEAAVGRAVLAMIGDVPLNGESRKTAVGLLAVAMEDPSPQALQSVLKILISGE